MPDDTVNITIVGRTTGFVALGFPTNPGGMLHSDAIIGWVNDDGSVEVNDYFITARY